MTTTLRCAYCAGTDLIITGYKYHGEVFYHLHHSDYDSPKRKCGFLAYDWDKQNMIQQFSAQIESDIIQEVKESQLQLF